MDDGYAFFTAVLAIKAVQVSNGSHPRCVIMIEGSEEGLIDDLIYYMERYMELLWEPSLVVCLDANAIEKGSMSITTSLRGNMKFEMGVKVAENNMHSGLSSGICPNPF